MIPVYKHEMRQVLTSLTSYVISAFLILFAAIYMTVYNLNGSLAAFEHTLSGLTVILLITVPVLTMKSISTEMRSKTDRLLYSLPISSFGIAAGKLLSLITVFAFSVLVISLFPLMLIPFGEVNLLSSFSAAFGFFLLGCSLLSVGLFVSSLTESQAVAAGLSFVLLLINFFLSSLAGLVSSAGWGAFALLTLLSVLLGIISKIMTGNTLFSVLLYLIAEGVSFSLYLFKEEELSSGVPSVLQSLCLFSRYNSFLNGLFDIKAIVFFLSVTVFFLFLTVQSLEKRRWG